MSDAATPHLELFYQSSSCSLAPHIALEEAGATFTPVLINLHASEQRSPAYLKINPKAAYPPSPSATGCSLRTPRFCSSSLSRIRTLSCGRQTSSPRPNAWSGWLGSHPVSTSPTPMFAARSVTPQARRPWPTCAQRELQPPVKFGVMWKRGWRH